MRGVQIEDGAFQNMPYLQQLWLNHNRLTRLPVALPASVRRLLVESNSVSSVTEDAFPAEGSQLAVLSLAGNHISTVRRGDLGRLPLLRALDLGVNNIRRLHADAFYDNARLRSLQLSRNPLSHLLADCFRGLAALRRLSLAFVPSAEVVVAPDAFRDLRALTTLDLDSSPALAGAVMRSDSLLSNLSGVRELGLLNSQLTGLRSDLPRYLPGLAVVRLSSSRWHCDASAAAWMRAWMSSTGVELVGAGEILCFTPLELRGRSLLTLADWELDGDRPTAPIVFRPAPLSTTIQPYPTSGSLSNWPRRHSTDFDEYSDAVDLNFLPAIYDDDDDDADDFPDAIYDSDDSRSRVYAAYDVSARSEVAQSFSTSSPTRQTEPEAPEVHGPLRLASTTFLSAPWTKPTLNDKFLVVPEAEVQRPTSSGVGGDGDGGGKYVVPLATVTIVATVVIAVVVGVAIAMMTRRKGISRKRGRRTSIELPLKPTQNGIKQNGGALRRTENGLTACRKNGEVSGCPRLPLVAFGDPATGGGGSGGGSNDDGQTAGATGLSCSVDALSLIPGRDINHEGPQRVYQWADF